ncbi:hypothetical protein N0V88_007206 [Collariella sp. IMI 366227]|nr:hypothetical protein N0V88_007206 [Collariella sp. IMI 366227]
MSRSFYDIDPAGDVLCTYTEGGEKESLRSEKTAVPLPKAILYAFLPAGYPHTVTDDYLAYQTFDSLQAFASSITSLLANRAVLEGLGVGDSSSSPTGALILKITGDTISRIATILFAHRMGQAIEPECKFYRFLADIFNDSAQFLDLLTPALPYLPKLGVIVSAGVLRSLCGVAANASKASLSAHFALTGNLAELNAKEASQETVIALKEGVKNPLSAWFDAVNHAYHFDSALKDGLESHYENEMPLGYVSDEQKKSIFAALRAAGWDLETNALETRLPVRIRVGDGKRILHFPEKEPLRFYGHQVGKKD